MAIKLDLAGLESSYRNMSDEEFSSLKRDDLTTEAAHIYDIEAIRRSTLEREAIKSATLAELSKRSLADSKPSELERTGPLPPQVQKASRIGARPPSTFWLTCKEFVSAMAALIVLGVLSLIGDANRQDPPHPDPFDTFALFGRIGGVYVAVFFGRWLAGQRRAAGSAPSARLVRSAEAQ
jgi:hypothetical protein